MAVLGWHEMRPLLDDAGNLLHPGSGELLELPPGTHVLLLTHSSEFSDVEFKSMSLLPSMSRSGSGMRGYEYC